MDLVNGLIRAGYYETAIGQEFNLASGKETRIIDLANMINEATGNQAGIKFIQRRKWDTKSRLLACIDRARELIGYEPRVEFKEGLANTIQWFKNNWDRIEKAAKLAKIHDFIISQPEGYDMQLSEAGANLSGGQKQRLAIARTFLTNPKILILDDSTSSVDSKTEAEIIQAIKEVSQDRTTFIITHRLTLIRDADVIIILKKGRIVAIGNHQELIKTSPDYQKIFGMEGLVAKTLITDSTTKETIRSS